MNAEPGEDKSDSASVHVIAPTGWADGSVLELRVGAQWGPQVTYRYRVSRNSGGQSQQPQPPQGGQLSASIECPQDFVVISELPSLNCALVISGWRRNTADPIEVSLPGMLDEFGNHANGIQIVDGDGTEDVFNWDEPHRWGFFVFACPAQSHTGANCNGHVTAPGPVTVQFIVRQKRNGGNAGADA